MYILYYIICISFLVSGCQKSILNGDELKAEHINYIKSLNLLDEDEKIHKFYYGYKLQVSGCFFTNKKVVNYWIDERWPEKNKIDIAYYKDIDNLDVTYDAGATYSPYVKIYLKNGNSFKLFFDDSKIENKRMFYNELKDIWGKVIHRY